MPGWLPSAAHLALFLILAFLLARSLGAAGHTRPVGTAFLLAFAYGALLELVQIPIEGRSGEWLDVILDGVGAAAGALGHRLVAGERPGWRLRGRETDVGS